KAPCDMVRTARRGGSRTGMLALGLVLCSGLTGCSSNNGAVPPSPTLPSLSPSAVSTGVQQIAQQLCDHLTDVRTGLSQLQASPSPDLTTATNTLANIGSKLRDDAQMLQANGQPQLAALASQMATGV